MPTKILSSNAEGVEPINYMGCHADLKKSSRNHQISRNHQTSRAAAEKISSPRARQSLKLREQLKSERHINHSYADLHHEIKKQNIGDGLLSPTKSSGNHQKQSVKKKATKDDELVKYMSNLPCYLQRVERGENLQDKVLNVGVLDWERLERWKYNQKQIPGRSSMNSKPTSSTSSTLPSGSDIGFRAHQRKQSSSLHSHLTSSFKESHSRGFKPSREAAEDLQGLRTAPQSVLAGQQKLTGTVLRGGNYSEIKPEKGKGKCLDPNMILEMGTSSSDTKIQIASFCPKGKTKGAEGESTQRMTQFQEFTLPDQHCPGRRKTIVLLLPRDSTKISSSGVVQKSKSTTLNDGRQTEKNYRSFTNSLHIDEDQFTEPYSDIPHSCPLPYRVETSKDSDVSLRSSVDAHGSKVPSDSLPTVQSKEKQAEENKSTVKPTYVMVNKPSNRSDLKAAVSKGKKPSLNDGRQTEKNYRSFTNSLHIDEDQFTEPYSDIPHSCPLPCGVETSKDSDMSSRSSVDAHGSKVPSDALPTVQSKEKQAEENKSTIKPTYAIVNKSSNGSDSKAAVSKGKNPSHEHRSSVGLGRISRSFSFKEGSALPQLSSTYLTSKSGPVESDSCGDNLKRDATTTNSRARSSPLRRLLDPLLKSKAANRLNSSEPLQDGSTSIHRACKSIDGWLDSSVQPVKRSLDFSSCRPTDADGSHQDEGHVTSMVQALLQVTVRNGLPFFTFAVDKSSNILEATMRKINTSGKHDCSWIYTFCCFHKIKKKSGGWMRQGSKGRSREYLRNVVGQMKVSSSQCSSKLTRHNSKDQFMVREFVLFGVEPRQTDQGTPDFQPNSELAAIVVKVSKVLPKTGFPEFLSEDRCSINSGENRQIGPSVENESFPSTVVILPSGVHGLAANGIPSPLIDRWISGGSCDCGGWDLGCKLRVLSNQYQCNKDSCSFGDSCTQDQFDLFVQGGAHENRLSFSLTSYSKGIYSVDFNASISSLQAFSICIAFLHNRNITDLSEVSNLFREITSQEPISKETDRIKVPTWIEGGAPPSYASFPPLSPVGRA